MFLIEFRSLSVLFIFLIFFSCVCAMGRFFPLVNGYVFSAAAFIAVNLFLSTEPKHRRYFKKKIITNI